MSRNYLALLLALERERIAHPFSRMQCHTLGIEVAVAREDESQNRQPLAWSHAVQPSLVYNLQRNLQRRHALELSGRQIPSVV